MHRFEYTTGIWRVETRLQDAGNSKRLAMISACPANGKNTHASKHTLVFDHLPGCDEVEEAKMHTRRVLDDEL